MNSGNESSANPRNSPHTRTDSGEPIARFTSDGKFADNDTFDNRAGKSSEDTSGANTASKILLMVGLLALIVTATLEVISRRRASRLAAAGRIRDVPNATSDAR